MAISQYASKTGNGLVYTIHAGRHGGALVLLEGRTVLRLRSTAGSGSRGLGTRAKETEAVRNAEAAIEALVQTPDLI